MCNNRSGIMPNNQRHKYVAIFNQKSNNQTPSQIQYLLVYKKGDEVKLSKADRNFITENLIEENTPFADDDEEE